MLQVRGMAEKSFRQQRVRSRTQQGRTSKQATKQASQPASQTGGYQRERRNKVYFESAMATESHYTSE